MQRGLDRIGYGNRDISGGLTRFWLQSSLKISPREQVGLLRALFNGSLPFAAEDIAVVKRDITLSSGNGVRFMGKTGSGSDDADRGIIGWFVGGVETPHNRWSFAVNIQGPDASGVRARGIAEAELADPNQIDDEAFRLIINAMLIAKYGTDVFKLKGETTHEP